MTYPNFPTFKEYIAGWVAFKKLHPIKREVKVRK